MISEPTVTFSSKTATSVTVNVTVPTTVTAPSTAHQRTLVYAENNRGQASDPVEITTSGPVTISGLLAGMTWSVFAISESDADEMSVPSVRLSVELYDTSNTNDLSDYFDVPVLEATTPHRPCEALALFLEAVGFEVHGRSGLAEKLVVGKNLFVDFLPMLYKERDGEYTDNPGDVWILVGEEPLEMPSAVERYNQKVDTLAVIEVHHGNRDTASADVNRLFHFFLRRENGVQFTACRTVVRHVRPTEPPSLVGEDDAHRSVYRIKLILRSTVDSS